MPLRLPHRSRTVGRAGWVGDGPWTSSPESRPSTLPPPGGGGTSRTGGHATRALPPTFSSPDGIRRHACQPAGRLTESGRPGRPLLATRPAIPEARPLRQSLLSAGPALSVGDGATSADTAPDHQHEDGADDGADDAGRLKEPVLGVLVEEQVAEETADERSDDPDHDRHDDRHLLTARHDQPGESAGDQADDDHGDDESEHGKSFGVEDGAGSAGPLWSHGTTP